MRERITLKTLAKILELSPSTISKSLSNYSEISAKTKERVKKAVALYDYVPNQHAQNLKFKRGKTIGVVIPTIQINFFSLALESIISEANKNDFSIVAYFSGESSKVERENIDFLIQIQVDGIIISPSYETQISLDLTHLDKVKQLEVPMVQFGGVIDKIGCDKISIDDHREAYQATESLILSGRKKILYISGAPGTGIYEKRTNGYLSAIINSKRKSYIFEYRNSKFSIEELNLNIKLNKIDGILISDELTAVQVMRNLLEWGYNIPNDISIIGFSTGVMGENYRPSLSAIDQRPTEQGSLAIKTLINRIKNKSVSGAVSHILQTSILHRGSTVSI